MAMWFIPGVSNANFHDITHNCSFDPGKFRYHGIEQEKRARNMND
jgi:hypothetical protein